MDLTTMTPAELRDEARKAREASVASFERSGNDGFRSQAASDVMASVYELQAEIMENGGRSLFLALYDTDGNLVPAVRIDSQYDRNAKVWMLLDSRRGSGRYLTPSKAQKPGVARTNDAKKGFYVGYALFPAVAKVGGGNSGAWYARAERINDRDFSDVVPVDNGHLSGEHAERWYRIQDGRFDRGE